MTDTDQESWKGRRVEFLLRDVHLPEPAQVLDELCGGDRLHGHGGRPLHGEVIDVSDNGRSGGLFVLIECDEVRVRCLLSAERVQPID
jgi:hypothetical protein